MSATTPDLSEVARFFQARTGVGLEGEAGVRAAPSIAACMRDAGFEDPRDYVEALGRDSGLFDALATRLTVGESYFFRDAWHFALVAGPILGEAEARRANGGPGLRLWSAGCADGQEVYSAAIALAEVGQLRAADLLATDLSPGALERARAGVYRPWALRGPQAERAQAWMRRDGDRWHLNDHIRRAVRFERHNLADPPPAGAGELDVILCRNVLIYLDPPAIAAVSARLAGCLRPGGWLITGPSDPPLGDLVGLSVEVHPEGVVYRRVDEARPEPAPPATRRRPRRDASVRAKPAPDLTRLRRLARLHPAAALEATERALSDHPRDVELAWLRANLLVALDRSRAAERALGEVIELAPDSAIAHYLRGSLRAAAADVAGARECFERALEVSARLAPDQLLPLSDGEPAGRLAEAAKRRLASLPAEGST